VFLNILKQIWRAAYLPRLDDREDQGLVYLQHASEESDQRLIEHMATALIAQPPTNGGPANELSEKNRPSSESEPARRQ
jgi:hypothetical protein